MNYFKILQLPIVFDLEHEKLEQQFFIVSNQAETKNHNAINKAYNVLKNDYTRGEHIIQILYPDTNLNNIKLEKKFLDKILQYNILLEQYSNTIMQNNKTMQSKTTDILKNKTTNQIKAIQLEYTKIYQQAHENMTNKHKEKFIENIMQIKFMQNILNKYYNEFDT